MTTTSCSVLGHRDYKTTEIYADFAPDPSQGAVWAERAFGSAADIAEGAAAQAAVVAGLPLSSRLSCVLFRLGASMGV